MMGQLSSGQERLFYSFNLEDHILRSNPASQIASTPSGNANCQSLACCSSNSLLTDALCTANGTRLSGVAACLPRLIQ